MAAIEPLECHRATLETDVREEQSAKGATAEAGHPKRQRAARPMRQDGMREDDDPVVTGQSHFPYPGMHRTRQPERQRFVGRRPLQTLAQHPDREAPSRLDALRQGTSVTQPVEKGDVPGSAQQTVTPTEAACRIHARKPDRVIIT